MNSIKNIMQRILIMSCLTLFIVLLAGSLNKRTTASTLDEEIVLEFASISDIHLKSVPSIEKERFAKSIQLSYQNTESLDAVVINGDFTDGGHDPQYANFFDVIDQNVIGDTEVIVNLGNHENGRNESDSHQYFTQVMGYGIDHVFEVNGYSFITVGVHYGDRYLDSQAIWLQTQLQQITAEDPDQPVFVLIHYPTYQTTANSISNGRSTFKSVLERFPQVVHISGHSHSPQQDPRMIYQDKFTSFNNGSLSYLFYEKADYDGAQDSASIGHFAIVKVTASNKVIIERHVIDDQNLENSVKLDGDYIIDIPRGIEGFEYTTGWYDNGTKPYFDANPIITLTKNQTKWLLTFNQAHDQQFVYYYHIYIKDVATSTVVKVLKPNSLFYKIEAPEILQREFSAELTIGNTYEITIYAISVTNRVSEPIVQTVQL